MEETKDHIGPLITALQYNDIFDLDSTQTDTEVLPKGTAFSFIKAVQSVNQRLVNQISTESLGFEVILIAREDSEVTKEKIVESVNHYGLGISKFYFCKNEELIKTLQSHKVKLFLSTNRDDIDKALQAGLAAASLYDQLGQHVFDQLKVIFSGDVIGFSEDSRDSLADFGFSETQLKTFKTAKMCIKEFVSLIGEMRRRFGRENSPLCTCLITAWGSRDVCTAALKTLREWGLDVDEAFCLAGAPCSPILAVVKPHILWDGGLHNVEDTPAQN
ncbi:cytosolic 5'-nucleotidase 1B [Misgurnus anguillicaudatus]|uniref:cytosolic 5'-nucleotidase 1B n=1 Tax=Misgurnus anguillicaudatus TaxID=75329 RepID=UPI003CCFBC97